MTQKAKASLFRAMHTEGRMLVLPNAWDVISAKLFEEAGFPAVATTSAGIANALGYPDGQVISREEMLFIVRRIANSLEVPVSADIEAGYGANAIGEVLKTIQGVLDSGAVGINLEDAGEEQGTLVEKSLQVERIQAIRQLAAASGVPLVINARTDPYFFPHLTPQEQFEIAVDRANAYFAAGADSLFVPIVTDRMTISNLVKAIEGPLNVLVLPGVPPLAELEEMGVRRVSMGSGGHRATLAVVRRIAKEFLEQGTYASLFNDSVPYQEVNALLAKQ